MRKVPTIIGFPDLDVARKALHNMPPARYSESLQQAIARARATKTKGRAKQRAIAAGRLAMAEQLFKQFPSLEGRWERLTASLTFLAVSSWQGDQSRFFLLINEAGAIEIGLEDLI